jgi:sulfatase maturation enzyme AslB (radical SAM superfamily)
MFEKTFCSSPWFHFRLTYDGSFESCRWAHNPEKIHKVQNQSLLQYYNSDQMRELRQQLLAGDSPDHCTTCYYEESFGKLNGRLRQLNKSAVDTNNFALTLRSSPHYQSFEHSLNTEGESKLGPADLQIDLGNTCNSACIMCAPEASSKLEAEYNRLSVINPILFQKPKAYLSWTKDPDLLDRVVKELSSLSNLRYIHFLGGETLYDEAFYYICEKLIENGMSKQIIVGTTTNGTIYNQRIQYFIENFNQFHLGVSIESVTSLNDYIRWPGKIDNILTNINKFLELRNSHKNLYVSLRITPNIFSIYQIDRLFEYMIENQVIAESCNILRDPSCLRIELIPDDIRQEIKTKLHQLIEKHSLSEQKIVNVRRQDQIPKVIADVILDYYKFVCDFKSPENADQLRYQLIDYIKTFEQNRKNYILDYIPRYEKFLRHYGY